MTQSSALHESAIIHPSAKIGKNVEIGPWTIIGEHVEIGDGCSIGSHVIKGPTRLGQANKVYQFCSIGEDCQDKKYAGEKTALEIGSHNIFRESCTVHRGTVQGGVKPKLVVITCLWSMCMWHMIVFWVTTVFLRIMQP